MSYFLKINGLYYAGVNMATGKMILAGQDYAVRFYNRLFAENVAFKFGGEIVPAMFE